jgi:hypothetical protein
MAAAPIEPLDKEDARKTYRYLRIGMIGAVVLLAVSIAIERSKVDCWQTSISAYYYTPVRAIFVGSMIAVGLSLIVYKGRGWEDVWLNFAGMLAPVVAVAPTIDLGRCWSVVPNPPPRTADGSLAEWVVTNIDNNIYALLIAGGIGLVVALLTAIFPKRTLQPLVDKRTRSTTLSLVATAGALLVVWLLIQNWGDFDTRAHGYAALLMFVFLILAIGANGIHHRRDWKNGNERKKKWFKTYTVVGVLMAVGGILIPTTRVFGEHSTLWLEGYEIVLFAVYWIAQTVENWNEEVIEAVPVQTQAAGS